MLCEQSDLSQRVSTYRHSPNSNFVHLTSPSFNMHSNRIPSETDRQSSTLTSSLVFDFSTTQVSSCINLFWLGLKGVGWAEMARCIFWNVRDIEQTEKMIPLVKGDFAYRQHVCELVSVSTNLIWMLFWSIFILSNYWSSETLWVWVKDLIVGLRPEKHLDYRFIIFNHVKQSVKWVFFAFCGNIIHIE